MADAPVLQRSCDATRCALLPAGQSGRQKILIMPRPQKDPGQRRRPHTGRARLAVAAGTARRTPTARGKTEPRRRCNRRRCLERRAVVSQPALFAEGLQPVTGDLLKTAASRHPGGQATGGAARDDPGESIQRRSRRSWPQPPHPLPRQYRQLRRPRQRPHPHRAIHKLTSSARRDATIHADDAQAQASARACVARVTAHAIQNLNPPSPAASASRAFSASSSASSPRLPRPHRIHRAGPASRPFPSTARPPAGDTRPARPAAAEPQPPRRPVDRRRLTLSPGSRGSAAAWTNACASAAGSPRQTEA